MDPIEHISISKNSSKYKLWMMIVVLVSTICKLFYVFICTNYKDYLNMNSDWYWVRAQDRFLGNIFNDTQWNMWAPFYHIFLSEIFKIINFFGFYSKCLEIVLVLHILLCSLSVWVLYLIALEVTRNDKAAFWAAATYAFSYGLIYFKAFVISENLAIPFFIFSIYLLFRNRIASLIPCGILLAIATGCRPVYTLVFFIFFAYILKEGKGGMFKKLLALSLSFFIVIFLIVCQVNYISKGKLKSLSPSSGVNFYLAFSKLYKFSSQGHCFIPPATSGHPENGSKDFTEPIYNSAYFFKIGFDYILQNPKALLEKFYDYKYFIWGGFIPYGSGIKGFTALIFFSRWQMLIMIIGSLFIWVVFKSKKADNSKLLMLISLPIYFFISHYFFTIEHRYLYAFAFVFHITFFAIIIELWDVFCKRRKITRQRYE